MTKQMVMSDVTLMGQPQNYIAVSGREE